MEKPLADVLRINEGGEVVPRVPYEERPLPPPMNWQAYTEWCERKEEEPDFEIWIKSHGGQWPSDGEPA